MAGVGAAVSDRPIRASSVLSCGHQCSITDTCTAANYFPDNSTCTMLHVRDPCTDWQQQQNVTYICAGGCEKALDVSVGWWPFIDEQVTNVWDKSLVVSTFNTPFMPALVDSTTHVLSFLGHRDSYVVLDNSDGRLAISSFTWAARILLEDSQNAQLFGWEDSSPALCYSHGPHIWLDAQKLFARTCNPGGVGAIAIHSTVMTLNTWHEVAVSYDASTGTVDLYTDGSVERFNIGLPADGITQGPVVMGSRYHYTGDDRYLKAKIACMRLWSANKDLNSMEMNNPLCDIIN